MDPDTGFPALAPGAEFDLIRRFYRRAPWRGRVDVPVGPGDDCAVVHGAGIALSSDMSVEGVHFRRDWLGFREIGFRAAAGALSDLAAVAARPIGVLVSLAVPEADAGDPAVEVMEGVREVVEGVGGSVLGGDVTRSPGGLVVDV
ncbi:MAG: AIR synthase related protein, partial [Gemmatimonadota bacterium]|nr:AIR synthase related protein [Gemmatimonadota bacterium]